MRLTGQSWLTDAKTRKLLAAFGQEPLRFVGGCVRDAMMDRPVGDIDCATPAHPQQVIALLEAANIKALPTGIAHGTVTAVIDKTPFEITTLRRDVACDGRHADVAYTDRWEEDAQRRDFTLNALYCDADGQIYDYTHGIEAAQNGQIRFIGNASARITEDALRILRFFRFFATHGHGAPDAAALAACRTHRTMLQGLSGERIQQEMFKLLSADKPLAALSAMQTCGVLGVITPIKRYHARALEKLIGIDHPLQRAAVMRLISLLRGQRYWIGGPTANVKTRNLERIAARWKLSGAHLKQLKKLLFEPYYQPHHVKWRERNRYDLDVSQDELSQLAILSFAHDAIDLPALTEVLKTPTSMPTFPLTGKDLIAEGIEPGPKIGNILSILEDDWRHEDFEGDKAYWLNEFRQLNAKEGKKRLW